MIRIGKSSRTRLVGGRLVIPPKKKAISIRVDEDVLDYFKKEGAGYQRRMNAVLRSYMQQKRKKRGVRPPLRPIAQKNHSYLYGPRLATSALATTRVAPQPTSAAI